MTNYFKDANGIIMILTNLRLRKTGNSNFENTKITVLQLDDSRSR